MNSSRPGYVSFQDAGASDRQNCRDRGESIGPSNDGECNIYDTERKDFEAYVRDVSPHWNSDINVNKKYDIREQLVCFKSCPTKMESEICSSGGIVQNTFL